jgi:DEAD/DEAH box helicase domain-containing protein
MAHDIVYFDLETKRTVNDVGGWHNKREMGMSIGVTYSTKLGEYRIYTEDTVQALIEQLRRADLVVGYNHVQFDYGVLLGYSVFDFTEHLRSLDLMVELEKKLGHRLKLEAVAHATLGEGKTADGLDAIRWWQQANQAKSQGNLKDWSEKLCNIAHYCCHDVKAVVRVHEHGAQHGHVKYHDRNQREQTVPVEWKL